MTHITALILKRRNYRLFLRVYGNVAHTRKCPVGVRSVSAFSRRRFPFWFQLSSCLPSRKEDAGEMGCRVDTQRPGRGNCRRSAQTIKETDMHITDFAFPILRYQCYNCKIGVLPREVPFFINARSPDCFKLLCINCQNDMKAGKISYYKPFTNLIYAKRGGNRREMGCRVDMQKAHGGRNAARKIDLGWLVTFSLLAVSECVAASRLLAKYL